MTVTQDQTIIYDIMNLDVLYASYLPFVKNGAIFVPCDIDTQLGDTRTLAITLPESTHAVTIKGKVVWVTYKQQANNPAGFAVQLSIGENGLVLKNEIERLLAGKAASEQSTYTM